jgi:hypothetical protein
MATIQRGYIGKEDLKAWDGVAIQTFTRVTSTGGTQTLTKIDAPDYETIDADGEILNPFVNSIIDTTVGAIAGTMPDGQFPGQEKTIIMTVDGGDYTLTVTHHLDGDAKTFTFSEAGAILKLIWNNTDWVTVMLML